MSRYVTISSIGPRPMTVPDGVGNQEAASLVCEWMEKNLDIALCDNPDLLVFPELCSRPYGCKLAENPDYFEYSGPIVLDMLAKKAKANAVNIIYPLYLFEGSKITNSMLLIDRSGKVSGRYDKAFLTASEIEAGVTPGESPDLVRSDVGTIAGVICFDLNFDPLRTVRMAQRPDLIVFSSMYHGGLMQPVWAYSCRSHFIGCVAGLPNAFYNPSGRVLYQNTSYYPIVSGTINLDGALFHIDYNQEGFDRAKACYGPALKITDPDYLGSVYITSESDEFTVAQVAERFNLEPLDHYFARSIRLNAEARGHDLCSAPR